MAKYSIEDLLRQLENPEATKLENNQETWRRIGNKDSFDELGLDASELDEFLTEFCEANPYSNL